MSKQDEYWKALIRGLTPEKASDVDIAWLFPAALFIIGIIFARCEGS